MVCQEYFKLRLQAINQLKEAGENPYPHKFHVSISLTDFITNYDHLGAGEMHSDIVSVAGTVNTRMSQKSVTCLFFQ